MNSEQPWCDTCGGGGEVAGTPLGTPCHECGGTGDANRTNSEHPDIDAMLAEIIENAERVKAETGWYPYQLRMTPLQRTLEPVQKSMRDVITALEDYCYGELARLDEERVEAKKRKWWQLWA